MSSESIGAQIKRIREEKHLTQTELATRTGTRQSNIARLESDRHVPTWSTLERVASALDSQLCVELQPRS